jgi:Tol biopolymer transport system component/DNA-binding winged helix-turn-helix (wHTH) protein
MNKHAKPVYEFGPYRLDVAERLLLRDGSPVPLTPKVFDTLLVLVENSGHLVEKDELMKRLWPDTFVEEVTLARNISDLRKALAEASNGQKYIDTVPKRGYRFIASVSEVYEESGKLSAEKATRSRLGIEEEESIAKNEAEAEQASGQKAIMMNARASYDASLMTQTPETNPQNQSTARTESGFRRLLLEARHYKPGHFLAIGVAVALIIMGFGFVQLIQNYRPATPPGVRDQSVTLKRLTYDSKSDHPAISADGKYLAYTVKDKDQASIWLKNLANGSMVQVMPPATNAYEHLAFSPDGNQLYYLASRQGVHAHTICRVPSFGGTPQDVVKDVWNRFALSPDGKQVAFMREHIPDGDQHLIIANVEGSGERDILQGDTDFLLSFWGSTQAWSPDGQELAVGGWKKDPSGDYAVLLGVRISDGTVREIRAPHWNEIHEVAWLSDNSGFIVTVADKEGAPFQIWQLAAASGEARRLTNDLNEYGAIGLTADSRTLVAIQTIDLKHIWVAPDGDASRARQLTFGANREDGSQGLYWTPSGKLVFVSSSDDENDLWMMDADGGNRQQLTTKTGGSNLSPRVTPDGRYIIFNSTRTGQSLSVWRMDADGNNQRQLSDGEGDASPAVSPDGRWVYYTAFNSSRPSSLRKVSIEGGDSVNVPVRYFFDRPAISPDGKLIAYYYRKDRTVGIAITSVESGEPLKLFESLPAFLGIARFTPDSQAILYINNSNIEAVSNIWRQPLDGSPPQQFTHFTEGQIVNFALSSDGHQLALARGQRYNDVVLITNFR